MMIRRNRKAAPEGHGRAPTVDEASGDGPALRLVWPEVLMIGLFVAAALCVAATVVLPLLVPMFAGSSAPAAGKIFLAGAALFGRAPRGRRSAGRGGGRP